MTYGPVRPGSPTNMANRATLGKAASGFHTKSSARITWNSPWSGRWEPIDAVGVLTCAPLGKGTACAKVRTCDSLVAFLNRNTRTPLCCLGANHLRSTDAHTV